jgi:glycosyltransferase involved in cell wall biosynthesis
LRILVAHSFYRLPGGEDTYVRQQVDLLRANHEVELLEFRNEGLGGNAKTAAQMTFSKQRINEAGKILDDFRPEVVHIHNMYPAAGPAVHLAAAKRRIPLVMTVHNFRLRCPNGYMFTEGEPCTRCEGGMYAHATLHNCFPTRGQAFAYAGALWTHRFVLRLERKISIFITPSEFMRNTVIGWDVSPERVDLVRNFTASSTVATSQPGSFGIFVGRLSSEKGLDQLLAALQLAGDPPFKIIGDGPLQEDLMAEARRLELQNTEFVGRIPNEEVQQILPRARFLAMPSICHENAPLAALEAMAAGRPLLVSKMGGLPELVESGGGLAFESKDTAGAADRVRRLMEDDELCRRAGSAALAFATQELSAEGHVRGLESAYGKAALMSIGKN